MLKKMEMSEYLALDALSSGVCHTLLTESPFHARFSQENPRPPSSVSDMGIAIHDALLEGVDRIVAIEAEDWRTKIAKEARDAARAAGNIPMLARKVGQVTEAIEAVKAFVAKSEIAGCFDEGQAEGVIQWDDDGVACKARPDWTSPKFHVSLKTTDGSANPDSWIRRQLGPMGYDTSLLFYERGFLSIGLQVEHRILLVEQNKPYGCCVIGLAPSRREYAASRVARALSIWRECQKSGKWPAYPAQTCFAEAMPYELAAEEERELSDAYDALQEKHGVQI